MITEFSNHFRVYVTKVEHIYDRDGSDIAPVIDQGLEIDAWVSENVKATPVMWAPNLMSGVGVPVYVFGQNGNWCIDFDDFTNALACDLRWG